ncbi:MAG TPA: MFS transporter [Streptosporangiaceae bacterium]|jgi:putative MFS transporter
MTAISHRPAGVTFRNAPVFWAGAAACTAGVLLHLPMYIDSRMDGYRMVGMQPDPAMLVGMALIVVGLAMTIYGLIPKAAPAGTGHLARARVAVVDDARITPALVGLLLVVALAVVIDAMKPLTLGFVAPGMAREYDLKSALNPHGGLPVALLPLVGITGTVVGSFAWGWLSDRIGRRSSIILAGLLFTTTAICGAMPGFSWNLAMCFMMGIGAGGLLPITFALMAETIPARHRGWLMVVIGGEITGTYALVSWLSAELIPHFSWRIMWLIGLPTGLLLILLSRWIPESPRFLLSRGRTAEASEIMDRFGARLVTVEESAADEAGPGRFRQLFYGRLLGQSAAIVAFGIGIGLVTYGFQLWIPTNLEKLGFTQITSSQVLEYSALIGFPLALLVAWLYGAWSSKKTIVLVVGLTTASLAAFVGLGNSVTSNHAVLYLLLAVPICASGSIVALLGAYSSEIYPTAVRGRGSGLAAGASKFGGVLILALVAAALAAPSIATTALIGAVPLLLAVLAFAVFGIETRGRRLEDISALPGQPVAAGQGPPQGAGN